MTPRDLLSAALVVAGLFFFFLGAVGILRFPDFFTRLHPAGKVDTLGASLVITGLLVHEGFTLLAAKVALVEVFVLLSSPTAAHALGRAALKAGLRPWIAGGER